MQSSQWLTSTSFAAFGKGVQVISWHRTNFPTNLAKWCTCHLIMISSQSWIEVTKGKALFTLVGALGEKQRFMSVTRHSPGAGWVGNTNWVDHVSDGGTPGSTVLCEFSRDFRPVVSPSCLIEGLPWSWLPTSSAGFQFARATCEVV